MTRAFIALDVSGPVVSRLVQLQETIPYGRIVPEENLHLTLAFLDEQSEEMLSDIHFALEGLSAGPIEVRLTGLEAFGGKSGPSVLVARAEPTAELTALRKDVRSRVARTGLTLPRERFRPHVTLARFGASHGEDNIDRLRRYLERNAAPDLPSFLPQAVVLYRSTLRPSGAVHEPLASYPLI